MEQIENKINKKQSKSFCNKLFFYSLFSLVLIVVGLSVAALTLALQNKFDLKKTNQNRAKNYLSTIVRSQIFRYRNQLPSIEKLSDNLESFSKTFDEKIPKETNITKTESKLFVEENAIYRHLAKKIGLDHNSAIVLENIKWFHNFELLFTTNKKNINNKGKNAILIKIKNQKIETVLVAHDNLGITKENKIEPLSLNDSKTINEKISKELKFNKPLNLLNSDFKIFLFKDNAAIKSNDIDNFDLAILINVKTLAIKLIARIFAGETTPKLKIIKNANSSFENSKTGFS